MDSMIPGFDLAKLVIYAAVAAAVFVAGMAMHKVFSDRKFAILEAKHSAQLAEWNSKVAEAQSKARAREAELQQAIDKQREEAADAIESIRQQGAMLSVARLDADRLRKQASAYAAGRGSSDSLAACQARADRLGTLLADGAVLLDEGQDLVAACAVRADERAVKIAACLKGWPSHAAPTH